MGLRAEKKRFKMDRLGILACSFVLVMFCPLQMANSKTNSETLFRLPVKRADHHPNTGHATNIRVRLQQESIATGL